MTLKSSEVQNDHILCLRLDGTICDVFRTKNKVPLYNMYENRSSMNSFDTGDKFLINSDEFLWTLMNCYEILMNFDEFRWILISSYNNEFCGVQFTIQFCLYYVYSFGCLFDNEIEYTKQKSEATIKTFRKLFYIFSLF